MYHGERAQLIKTILRSALADREPHYSASGNEKKRKMAANNLPCCGALNVHGERGEKGEMHLCAWMVLRAARSCGCLMREAMMVLAVLFTVRCALGERCLVETCGNGCAQVYITDLCERIRGGGN